jgi:hypothetical protein
VPESRVTVPCSAPAPWEPRWRPTLPPQSAQRVWNRSRDLAEPLQAAAKDAGLITDAARAAGMLLGIAETVRGSSV